MSVNNKIPFKLQYLRVCISKKNKYNNIDFKNLNYL